MKVTSATLVTLVSIVGTLATSLTHSGDPRLALAGLVLASVYTVCHAFVSVNAPAAAPSVPAPTQDAISLKVEAPVVAPAPTEAPKA